jgi:hypothetical protein
MYSTNNVRLRMHQMQCGWLGERVATANVARVVENVLRDREESGWGPNAVFRFPQRGGTGAIWSNVSTRLLPRSRQRFGQAGCVVALDAAAKVVTTADCAQIRYKKVCNEHGMDVFFFMNDVEID